MYSSLDVRVLAANGDSMTTMLVLCEELVLLLLSFNLYEYC